MRRCYEKLREKNVCKESLLRRPINSRGRKKQAELGRKSSRVCIRSVVVWGKGKEKKKKKGKIGRFARKYIIRVERSYRAIKVRTKLSLSLSLVEYSLVTPTILGDEISYLYFLIEKLFQPWWIRVYSLVLLCFLFFLFLLLLLENDIVSRGCIYFRGKP